MIDSHWRYLQSLIGQRIVVNEKLADISESHLEMKEIFWPVFSKAKPESVQIFCREATK
jgi:hypothetical protein